MLQNIRGIVLRSIKYGETSLVSTIFTRDYGVQSYIVQGVRSSKSKNNRAGVLQPAFLLDLTIYHKPGQNLQRIKEFHPAYIYKSLQEDVVKNCIAMFSAELLLRLLPASAPAPELFDFSYEYFSMLDAGNTASVANYPLQFIIGCCGILGYDITSEYLAASSESSAYTGMLQAEDTDILSRLCDVKNTATTDAITMNAATRNRLLDWLLSFMHNHTSHMSELKSLQVLRAVLH